MDDTIAFSNYYYNCDRIFSGNFRVKGKPGSWLKNGSASKVVLPEEVYPVRNPSPCDSKLSRH